MRKTCKLTDLDCANCAAKIEAAVKKIDGVTDASVSFMTQKMSIEAEDAAMNGILSEVKKVVAKVDPDVTVEL